MEWAFADVATVVVVVAVAAAAAAAAERKCSCCCSSLKAIQPMDTLQAFGSFRWTD